MLHLKRYLFSLIALFTLFQIFRTMSSKAGAQQVIVVGSGLAGLSAAHSALQHGARVTLLEMMPKYGGNSIKASSGINGAPTRFQPIKDDELFYADTVRSSGVIYQNSDSATKKEREALMHRLVDQSQSAVYWLADGFGVDLAAVSQLGGHSRPRTHRGTGRTPPGFAIVSTLWKALEASDKATLRTQCRVTKLVTESNGVVGVEFHDMANGQSETLYGPVVFAVGGFAGDTTGLVNRYRPDLAKFPSTNTARPQSIGLLEAIGAHLMDMESIQVHPTGFVSPENPFSQYKFLAAEMLRGEGGILLDSQGDRFANEVLRRDEVTDAITGHCNKDASSDVDQWSVWLAMDEGSTSKLKDNIGFYVFKKLMAKKPISEWAKDLPDIKNTIKKYAAAVQDNKDSEFGRTQFGRWSLKPEDVTDDTVITAGRITPVLHFTMGGAKINPSAQFLDQEDKPIPGVWGAGEITAGVHSSNRLGGSSLLECVVFGRTAGENAAKTLKSYL